MVSVTSEVSSNVPAPSAPSKSAKSQPKPAGDQFGSLVDSNTDAAASTQAPDPAPRRSDASKTTDKPTSDKGPRDSSASDPSAQAKSNDPADGSAPVDKTASAEPDKGLAKTKDKSDTSETKSASKSNDGKTEQTDETDGLAAAVQAADATQQQAARQTAPDPTAIIVPAPVVATDPAAAGAQAGTNTDSPLTIAAAGIAASASIAAQIAAPTTAKTDTTATADPTAKTTDAAAAKAAAADAAAVATTDTAVTEPQTSGALIAAVDKATPKTSFKDAVAVQSNKDVSDIAGGQDTAKPGLIATTDKQAVAATNAPVHAQTAKPEANGTAGEAKTDAADRSAPAVAAPTPHGHSVNAQAQVNTADVSTQAAAAIQAPVTNTVSNASASTATLTATAATSTAVPLSGLPVEIAAAARAGKTQFDVRLDPAELGRIDVRIAVDRNGQVTSHLTVEKPETLSMLRQDAPQLQRALDDAGLKTGNNSLSFSLRDQNASSQNNGNNQDNGGNARRLIISEDDQLPAAPVRGYGRMLGASGGVDIRV